ncbi:MAG: hypothetical protein HQ463_05220, partial [Bacteroidetes bacterium]|nr:hypothetical protein [Bacteroidota bacterium]
YPFELLRLKRENNRRRALDPLLTPSRLPLTNDLCSELVAKYNNIPELDFGELKKTSNQEIRTSDSIRFAKDRENYHKYMPYISFYDSAYNETIKQIKDLELLMGK